MAKNIDFIIAKVRAFQQTLERIDNHTKKEHVPIQLAENFNAIVAEIAKESPDAAVHLPQPIFAGDRLLSRAGPTTMSYIGLETFVGQVLGVLEVLKGDN